MSGKLYNAISNRYAFSIPEEYQRLEARGLFKISSPAQASAVYRPGTYLWFNDMEWYSLQQIVEFHFADYHLPGFVPFAFTAGGDYWCWHPKYSDSRGAKVLLCYRDDMYASIYAPNFHTALFRHILDFCKDSCNETDNDVSALLRRWATDLSVVFPDSWCTQVRQLADDSKRLKHAMAIEQTEVAFDGMDAEVQWMRPRRLK